jgi:hypothetical protein
VLEEELKRLATALRVPVSNLVRAILEDAVDAADLATRCAEDELRGFTERLAAERERLRARVTGSRASSSSRERERGRAREGATGGEGGRSGGAPAPVGPSEDERRCAGKGTSSTDPHGVDAAEAATALAGVIGFQPLLLATRATCARCGRPLAAGEEALLGIRDDGGPRVIVGRECRPGAGHPLGHVPG